MIPLGKAPLRPISLITSETALSTGFFFRFTSTGFFVFFFCRISRIVSREHGGHSITGPPSHAIIGQPYVAL